MRRSDRGDQRILGISDVRPRSAAALEPRPHHAPRRRRASDVPVGSNGASQAILDARFLADRLKDSEHPAHALWLYEQTRLPMTAEIVRSNRRGGPEGVIDAVEAGRRTASAISTMCSRSSSARRSCAATPRRPDLRASRSTRPLKLKIYSRRQPADGHAAKPLTELCRERYRLSGGSIAASGILAPRLLPLLRRPPSSAGPS